MAETELELKFVVPRERLPGVRDAMAATGSTRIRMQAHYFDTPDAALAKARVALRLRKEGRRWVQTLKAEGPSRVHRLEHEVALPAAGPGVPALDLARHDGTEAGAALERALKHRDAGDPPPAARYGTDVRRVVRTVDDGGSRIEIALDEGRIVVGEKSVPVCEVEFELKAGRPERLFAVARAWRAAHGLLLATASKAERGERLAGGETEVPPAKAATPKLDAAMDGDAVLRAVASSGLDQIVGNAGEVAAGPYGADHVHQLRIGIRRLRTVLRELAALSPAVESRRQAWEAPLVQAFRALGEWRDRDTAAGAVQPGLRAAGAPSVDWPRPAEGQRPDPAAAVRADAFQHVLLDLLEFTLTPPSRPAAATVGAHAARDLAVRRLRKLHRAVVRDGRRFETLDEARQHRVRKRLKRLRYLVEAVAPLFGGSAVERYLKHLRPAQDALGAHNDAHVAIGYYRQAAERDDPKAWFAVGWLEARQQASAKRCRRALKTVGAAARFWKG